MPEAEKRAIYIEEGLCNGCRMCEMMCSFMLTKGEFNPAKSRVRVVKDDERGSCLPVLDSAGVHCCNPTGEKLPPCVEFCPTGALMFCTFEEALERRALWPRLREINAEFKVRAPWRIEGRG